MQFKRLKSYFVVILCFSFLFFQPKKTTYAINELKSNVKANMEFKIKYIKEEKEGEFNYSLDKISYKPLCDAQVIVIDNISGEIITSGYSNKKEFGKLT